MRVSVAESEMDGVGELGEEFARIRGRENRIISHRKRPEGNSYLSQRYQTHVTTHIMVTATKQQRWAKEASVKFGTIKKGRMMMKAAAKILFSACERRR